MAYTEAHRRAMKKYREKNREKTYYQSNRASAKTFCTKHATMEDIVMLRKLLTKRKRELKEELKHENSPE